MNTATEVIASVHNAFGVIPSRATVASSATASADAVIGTAWRVLMPTSSGPPATALAADVSPGGSGLVARGGRAPKWPDGEGPTRCVHAIQNKRRKPVDRSALTQRRMPMNQPYQPTSPLIVVLAR